MKTYREKFNDGFLTYGHKKTKRSDGKRVGEAFIPAGKLAFEETSCRDSDYRLADVLSSSLDLKVKTPYPPSFKKISKNKLKVIIEDMEYDVIRVDSDRHKTVLFFHLQEVGVIRE
ncbi:phage head-tail adapter protein [Halalkalibacterium halodurans]|uniref:phage head-tail adapter protein n=1 Tax=Halalkalibacterium halodurans TaxID=86665 RepID=UPI002E206E0C|nr:phage head-tail adapter protein [Halalkalibacterium halodurans]